MAAPSWAAFIGLFLFSFLEAAAFERVQASKFPQVARRGHVRAGECHRKIRSGPRAQSFLSGSCGSHTSPQASPGRDAVPFSKYAAVCRTKPMRWARDIGSFGESNKSTS